MSQRNKSGTHDNVIFLVYNTSEDVEIRPKKQASTTPPPKPSDLSSKGRAKVAKEIRKINWEGGDEEKINEILRDT